MLKLVLLFLISCIAFIVNRTDAQRGWLNAVENSGVVNGRIEYSYDAAGNKTSVESISVKDGVEQKNKTLFTYDALGRTDLVTFSDGTTTRYGYDIVGNRETITRSNGTGTLYRFDNQNRLTSQQNVRGAGTPGATTLSSFIYEVREDGKRTGVREQVLNPLNSSVAMTTRTIGYDFDGASRLTRETREERQSLRAGGETSSTRVSGYEYDAVSNRKKLTTNSYNGIGDAKTLVATSTVDYSYNAADELTEETTTQGASTSTKTYTYDDNGAQSSVTSNGVTTPYSYDFEGKLVSVGDASSSTRSSYVYDGDGNRLSSIVTTGGVAKTVRYLNDTNTAYVQVVEERDENGTLQARYDYGDMDLQKLYRRDQNTGTYLSRWYLNDGLESTRQLVDANGVVTDSYAYDAFGAMLQRAGETENTRLYNGQQQDDTGLYFLRARYYNSGNGRFLNHDPLLGNSDDPVTLHRYLYCANDPINHTDPSGESFVGNVVAVGNWFATTFPVANAVWQAGNAGTSVAVGVAGSYNLVTNYMTSGEVDWHDVVDVLSGLPMVGKAVTAFSRANRARRIIANGGVMYTTVKNSVVDAEKASNAIIDMAESLKSAGGRIEAAEIADEVRDIYAGVTGFTSVWKGKFFVRINPHEIDSADQFLMTYAEELLHVKQMQKMVADGRVTMQQLEYWSTNNSWPPKVVMELENEVLPMLREIGITKEIKW